MISEHPIWYDRSKVPDTHLADKECDVLIVGGGISGLVTGIELLRGGADVSIFDALSLGEGGSGRAFGSIAIGANAANLTPLRKIFGEHQSELLWKEASSASLEFERYIVENGINCNYIKNGHIRLAVSRTQERSLRQDAEDWKNILGSDACRLVSKSELGSELPASSFSLGLLDEQTATIDPYLYLVSLSNIFFALGGRYISKCRVLSYVKRSNGFVVKHELGETRSKELVVVTNGYTDRLSVNLKRRIFPIGSYMIATEKINKEIRAKFNKPLRVFTTAHHYKNYFRFDDHGHFIFGGRSSLLDSNSNIHNVVSELRSSLARYFPELADTKVTHVWGGSLGFTFNGVPHIGNISGVYHAGGYCGRGLPMATLFGRELANSILGGSESTLWHSKAEFKTRWYYRGKPWFLPIAGSYYRWKDKILNKV